jgi:HAMP domain-containing protein
LLNNTLHTLARGYEQEIARTRSRVEADQRYLLEILSVLAVLGAAALGGGVLFVKAGLLKPVLRMRDAMLRLAEGDLDTTVDEPQRAHELAEMARAVSAFHTTLVERQSPNREARLLSDLNDWLQSCNSLGELYQMVADFLGRLLPGCAGSLYIYSNSRDVLESAKVWNGGKITPAMHADDCWDYAAAGLYIRGKRDRLCLRACRSADQR